VLQLFRDSLHELYDMLYDIDADHINHPEDIYNALSDAIDVAKDSHYADFDTLHTLYLLELYKIVKIGGTHSPYACI